MPVNPTYPGVYIEEIPSGVRAIRGVATSVAAFIGTFSRGLHNEAVRVLSLSDFEREYGGLNCDSEASYAVQQFFLNGGSEAWLIRVGHPGPTAGSVVQMTPATGALEDTVGGGGLTLAGVTAGRVIRDEPADNPGAWGNQLRLEVTHNTSANDTTFNLTVKEVRTVGDRTSVLQEEVFRNLTMQPNEPNTAIEVVNSGSRLIFLSEDASPVSDTDVPHTTGTLGDDIDPATDFAGATPTSTPTVAEVDGISVTVQFGPAATADDIGPIALDFSDRVAGR